jgi:hypothetical protein
MRGSGYRNQEKEHLCILKGMAEELGLSEHTARDLLRVWTKDG